jgi:two-component system cell cycle response regulator
MVTPETSRPIAHLCQQFGFTEEARQQRLALMELGETDLPFLQQAQQLAIYPHGKDILDRFYDFLEGFSEMQSFLGNPEHLQRLKSSQAEYLKCFGLAFDDIAYFEYRLRIGIAHERVGLPLHLYLAGYRKLEELILATLPATAQAGQSYAKYVHSIHKIVMLDISLAIDAYSRRRAADMTESLHALMQERDVLNTQLMHDTLTGTLSRRFILETLNKQLAQLTRQPDRRLSIALLDLDHFKVVNDTFGHLVGDKVLYEFSRVVSSRVREQDYFGRFGGEEFLLILIDIAPDEAKTALNRILEATQLQVFTHNGKHIPLTVSIGFTTALPDEKVDDLIDRADSALYQAKQRGRNRVVSL